MRIVVLGGLGNFGARICRALVGQTGIEIVAASRSPNHGPADICTDPRIRRVTLDTGSPHFSKALKDLSPELVIHCAGPFQGQDYRVVHAAILAGAHYIDLADGRDFVARFSERNDSIARSADVVAISGASTVPAPSSAVVDHVARRFRTLEEIQIVIAPAQRAPEIRPAPRPTAVPRAPSRARLRRNRGRPACRRSSRCRPACRSGRGRRG